MNDDEKLKLKVQIGAAFRPSAPIDKYSLFASRESQTDRVIEAVLQPGQHVILYGERGVGKTSLARVFAEILEGAGIKTVDSGTINCDATDDFSSLWHKALKELTFKFKALEGTHLEVNLDELVPTKITPDDVKRALSALGAKSVVVFDEFDRLEDRESRVLMADTIKTLSDHSIDATLLLVGVSESVSDLIGAHESIDRALMQIRVPRMSASELRNIIVKGLSTTEITMEEGVMEKIIKLSHGLPHYTHLLSLNSGFAALKRKSSIITDDDFGIAVRTIVEDKHTVADAYHAAVASSQRSSNYEQVLLACALCQTDDQGFFKAIGVSEALAMLKGKSKDDCKVSEFQRHLNELISPKRGEVLQRKGSPRSYRYRFANPLLQPYTIIHCLAKKKLAESQLWIMDQACFGKVI